MKHISAINIFIAGLLLVNTIGFADETNRMNEGTEIMKDNKISLGAEIKLMTPVWVIGSYDKAGKANMMTAAWVGICCSKPPCVSIALRKATYTYTNIMERKAFTVNIPSKNYVKEADYFGLVSGRDVDKLAATGLTPIKGEKVDAPYLKEFPVAVECKLINTVEVGLHTIFIGEIMDVKADKSMVSENNSLLPCGLLFNPTTRDYYGIGEQLGKAFSAGKEIPNKIVVIDEDLCTGCGACVKLCPKKILFLDKTNNVCRVTDESQCDKRRGCERVCPAGAIKIH